jgi:pimeloyl-ACP methyl ester carboxylesterase
MLSRPDASQPAEMIAHLERLMTVIGSPAFPPDPQRLRSRLQASVERALRPAGTARQLAAIVADGDRSALLTRIQAPTVVIHGQADPLVPVAAGHDLQARIAAARADIVPGMGHDLPQQLLPRFADTIADNARRG